MYYLNDLCLLCLVHNKNIKRMENSYLKMREEFQYFLPKQIFHNSETPKYVCNDCMKILNKVNAFRTQCLKNIAIFKKYEQKLTQYPGSHKYLTIGLTDILHQNNTEINCHVKIKTEIFEVDDSKIQNDIKINESCEVTENEEKICDRNIKTEMCETDNFEPSTEYQTEEISKDSEIQKVFIKVEDKIENININHRIKEELIINEDDKQENYSGIHNDVQQEPFCNQNSAANENDSETAASMCTQNQDPLQNIEIIKCETLPETYFNNEDLKIHDCIYTKDSQICDVCQKSSSTANYSKTHKPVNTGEKSYDVLEDANAAKYQMLPEKTKLMYQKELEKFTQWQVEKRVKGIDENVMMAYFNDIGPASAWSRYSMLKSTLFVSQNVDISRFSSLTSFLKTKCRNYQPKKAATFSKNDISKFLLEAPDQQWILQKVMIIMGIFGGCRCDELCRMMINDIQENFEDVNPTLVVNIPVTKTGVARSFTVVENGMGINFLDIYRKYKERRPIPGGRFFLQFRKGAFTSQVLGVNSIAKIPAQIAEYLNLPDKESFTGHSFRRTSAIFLADSGADILTLKRHGSWKSNSGAESYVSASKTSKIC